MPDLIAITVGYTHAEILELSTEWLIKLYGHPKTLDETTREKFYASSGLIYHFLRDHFPTK